MVGDNQISSDETLQTLRALYDACLNHLGNYQEQDLISKVPDKEYFSFSNGQKMSRAINRPLYFDGRTHIDDFFGAVADNNFTNISSEQITSACYSIAISFCACIDIEKSGDQKTPGTYFEYLIGFLFSRKLGVSPTKRLEVLNLDMQSTLPTDFIFDLGADQPKFHVPVKTSTRERVIQVWAHQRVLDGVYGTGRFLGTLACLSETKTDKKKLEVVEICLPLQWRLYQMYIAQMKRVYYLDRPVIYSGLNEVFPKIHVRDFGEFYFELDELLD